MKMRAAWLIFLPLLSSAAAQDSARRFVTNDRLTLGTASNLSASVRIADVDGNGQNDVIVANGRHWPGQNYVFLNSGRGRFSVQRELGADLSTSYATEPADLNGDGKVDIVVGNDMAPNRGFLSLGGGRFEKGTPFGSVSSLRSVTVADMDGDGDIDVLTTCRRRPNQILTNDGNGALVEAGTFGTKNDSTIDVAVTDWNGRPDIRTSFSPIEDSQPNAILINDGKLGFAKSIPFGTRNQQTRAVAVADMNGDGHADVVAGNIGQPNRIYFGDARGAVSGSVEFGRDDGRTYSLVLADMNNDKHVDVVVGNAGQPNAVFFNEGGGKTFSAFRFGADSGTYSVGSG